MSEWIYSFREGETRELRSSERKDLRAKYVRLRSVAIVRALLSATMVVPFIVGIALLSDHTAAGWAVIVASVFAFFKLIGPNHEMDRLGLLYRRASRLGAARRWDRDVPPYEIRAAYSRRQRTPVSEEEEEGFEGYPPYWEADERFERDLEQSAGGPVDWFETVGDDAVILTLAGKPVKKAIDVPIVNLTTGE